MDTLKTTIHDIDELIPDPDNVREHPSENHQALVRSIKRFGIRKPIVAHEGSKVVYAGNETLKVALELGITEIPVSWIPADVSETVCKAYAIADNRTNDLSLFDDEGLADLLHVLHSDEGIELEDVGFTLDDLKSFNHETHDVSEKLIPEEFLIMIECENENDQAMTFEDLQERGYKCHILIS